MRTSRRIITAVCVAACAAVAGVSAAGAGATTPDYDNGLALGTAAYQYGIPLLDTQRIFRSSTSVNVPDGLGHGRPNEFSNVRRLANANEHTVVAPNNDTLYSMAWLDLRKQPQVLHAPPIKGRFWEFELVDPWTNNFFNVSTAHKPLGPGDIRVTGGGDWAVTGPGFHGKLPKGVTRVRSPYDRVWVIGRTYVRDKSDLRPVHAIQNRYSITPLSKLGKGWHRRPPRHPDTTASEATIPGTQAGDDPLDFYAALGRQMQKFPPPARDDPILAQLAPVGIGPGLDPRDANLSADTLQGLSDAVGQGPANVQASLVSLYFSGSAIHDGYLVGDLGNWGTDYELRAVGDKAGVGGQRANVAVYPFTFADDHFGLLTGSNRYVLHIPKSSLPVPVKAFWSLTLYNGHGFFVRNPLNRYVLNDRSNLRRNPDGSIDLYVQHDEPASKAQQRNWLPSPPPGSHFRLIWRLYDLAGARKGVLDGSGWQPPKVQLCDGTGHAGDGTPCAS